MADRTLDLLREGLRKANEKINRLNEERPPLVPSGTATPTGADTSTVWRHRLTAGRPAFVGDPAAPDANRRTLASVDPRLVHGVNTTEPASAAKDRTEIAALAAKLDAKNQADRDLERAKAVLNDTANDPAATHADMNRWQAEVRRLTQVQSTAASAAKAITHETIRSRQSALDNRIDAHRERIAGAVISDLERALPAAVVSTVMQAAAERARDTGSGSE